MMVSGKIPFMKIASLLHDDPPWLVSKDMLVSKLVKI